MLVFISIEGHCVRRSNSRSARSSTRARCPDGGQARLPQRCSVNAKSITVGEPILQNRRCSQPINTDCLYAPLKILLKTVNLLGSCLNSVASNVPNPPVKKKIWTNGQFFYGYFANFLATFQGVNRSRRAACSAQPSENPRVSWRFGMLMSFFHRFSDISEKILRNFPYDWTLRSYKLDGCSLHNQWA